MGQLATHFIIDKELGAEGTNEALKSGELTFADLPHWENLFKFLDLAMEYGPDKPLEVDWETSENMLANGDAAMIHMGDGVSLRWIPLILMQIWDFCRHL